MTATPAPGGSALAGDIKGKLILPNSIEDEAFSGTQSESPTAIAMRRLREDKVGITASIIFILVLTLCIANPLFSKYWSGMNPTEQRLSGTVNVGGKDVEVVSTQGMPQIGPGFRKTYTFGADSLGRDVFIRALAGGSVSLRVGFTATTIAVILGVTMGLIGGFYGGWVDRGLQFLVDVMIALPFMLIAIAVSSAIAVSGEIMGIPASSIWVPIGMLGFMISFGFSRIVRARAKELAGGEFVEASRALGANDGRIMFRHILPHLIPTVITYSGILFSGTILGEAGMSFLGVGVLPPTPSWGNLINDGRVFYSTAWWIAASGGLFVVLVVTCVNLMGQSLEEAFDPKGTK